MWTWKISRWSKRVDGRAIALNMPLTRGAPQDSGVAGTWSVWVVGLIWMEVGWVAQGRNKMGMKLDPNLLKLYQYPSQNKRIKKYL